MKTRTLFLALTLFAAPLFGAGSALAQDAAPRDHSCERGAHGEHGRGPGRRADRLVTTLGLDTHQEAAVRQIFDASRPRFEQIRQMTDTTARQTAMRALRAETRSSIDSLLTPSQRTTLDAMHAARGERGRGHRHGHGHGGSAPSSPAEGI